MNNPIVYLCIDNCFASKRWVRPSEWMRVIKDLGIQYVEASADTECDPLYMSADYTRDWIKDVKENSERTGVRVVNLYSGHGTYATCGISHYDRRIVQRFCNEWMKKQIDTANEFNAGFGFFAHGFEQLVLQEEKLYKQQLDDLYDVLAELSTYAYTTGMRYVGLEQMYSPHQPPWTIKGTRELIKQVFSLSKAPFYITADLGHMNGQQYFLRPDTETIRETIQAGHGGSLRRGLWFGTDEAYSIYKAALRGEIGEDSAVEKINSIMDEHPSLFSDPRDSSVQCWLEELACYSPIIHLQQTDGKSSPHWPFTPEYNQKGIINRTEVIKYIKHAYSRPNDPAMPPKCKEIYLTIEPFIKTAGNVFDFIEDLEATVEYWRKTIPNDGMRLGDISCGTC